MMLLCAVCCDAAPPAAAPAAADAPDAAAAPPNAVPPAAQQAFAKPAAALIAAHGHGGAKQAMLSAIWDLLDVILGGFPTLEAVPNIPKQRDDQRLPIRRALILSYSTLMIAQPMVLFCSQQCASALLL